MYRANEAGKCGESGVRPRFELGEEKRRPLRRHVVQAGAPEMGEKGRKGTRRGKFEPRGQIRVQARARVVQVGAPFEKIC